MHASQNQDTYKNSDARGFDTEADSGSNDTDAIHPFSPKVVLPALIVSVSNGHLKYARFPILIGHFMKDGILSAEKVIDQLLAGELCRRLDLGAYPGPIGTSESWEAGNGQDLKGVLIVGLGKQGELNEFQLTNTVEQGVINH